jgi:hypothetical protein
MKILKNLTFGALAAAAFAALCAIGLTQSALADPGGEKGHTFDVTFTKWISTWPNMVGFVGGDVGAGTFAGEILDISDNGAVTTIHAIYHFYGSEHSFTAHVTVMEDDVTLLAVITGRVSEGWLEGASITGEYKDWLDCPIAPPYNGLGPECFQGALNINKHSDN